jgi:hypothetical protein
MCVLIFLNQGISEETVQLLKKEESHKVIAQGISALLRLGELLPDNVSVHQKLVLVAKQVSTVLIDAEGVLGEKYFNEKKLQCDIQSYMHRMNNAEFAAVFVLPYIVMSTVVLEVITASYFLFPKICHLCLIVHQNGFPEETTLLEEKAQRRCNNPRHCHNDR